MRFLEWLSLEQLCFIIPKKGLTVKYFPIFEGPLYIFYYVNTKKLKLMQKYIVIKFFF